MSGRKKDHPRVVKRKVRDAPTDIELQNFTILPELIGKGSYSNIWRAQAHHDVEQKIAVKVTAKNAKRAKVNYDGAVNALRRLQHPNIIRLLSFQETSEYYYEFMQYLEQPVMTLTDLLEKNDHSLPVDAISPIFRQLVSALAHIHSRSVGHRDIKPDNIMVHPQTLHVTIIDFGFAVSSLQPCDDFCGSPIYAAPEILSFEPYQVDLADLWSLGVVLFQMCYGAYPFPAQTMQELTAKVTKESLKFPPTASNAIREMQPTIVALLQKHPRQRISAAALSSSLGAFEGHRTFTPGTEVEDDAMELATS